MNPDIVEALRRPFDAKQIGKLPRVVCKACQDPKQKCDQHKPRTCATCKAYVGKHIHNDFVGHAHVTERLIEVDPDWNWEPLAFSGNGLPALDDNGGLWIRLTVGGKTMLGYGSAPGKRAPVKELIGYAIRNASMRFGVALDLWKKEAPEPEGEEQERSRPQVPVDRAAELRGQINAIRKSLGKSVEEIAEDFTVWSQGQDITRTSVAVLAEYKDHLQRGAA